MRTINYITILLLNGNKCNQAICLFTFRIIFVLLNVQILLSQVLTMYRLVILSLPPDINCNSMYNTGQTAQRIFAQINQLIISLFIPIFILFIANNMKKDSGQATD